MAFKRRLTTGLGRPGRELPGDKTPPTIDQLEEHLRSSDDLLPMLVRADGSPEWDFVQQSSKHLSENVELAVKGELLKVGELSDQERREFRDFRKNNATSPEILRLLKVTEAAVLSEANSSSRKMHRFNWLGGMDLDNVKMPRYYNPHDTEGAVADVMEVLEYRQQTGALTEGVRKAVEDEINEAYMVISMAETNYNNTQSPENLKALRVEYGKYLFMMYDIDQKYKVTDTLHRLNNDIQPADEPGTTTKEMEYLRGLYEQTSNSVLANISLMEPVDIKRAKLLMREFNELDQEYEDAKLEGLGLDDLSVIYTRMNTTAIKLFDIVDNASKTDNGKGAVS